jgi:hypothetical protein
MGEEVLGENRLSASASQAVEAGAKMDRVDTVDTMDRVEVVRARDARSGRSLSGRCRCFFCPGGVGLFVE